MIGLLRALAAVAAGRSARWPAVRRAHLRACPACAACGRVGGNDVHHVEPFHRRPDLELDPANLLTLCPADHLVFGHLHDWGAWNPAVRADATSYRAKVAARPGG